MVLTWALVPVAGEGWVHEPKLGGWRCLAKVRSGKLRLWTPWGMGLVDHAARAFLPIPGWGTWSLTASLVALSKDGRADFDLFSPVSRPVTAAWR